MRHDVLVVSGAPQSAHGQGEPQPFTHLSVPNADLYRSLLRIFARAKERFIVHLRPEDVAAELRVDADEQLTQALDQLVVWGNLRADVDTSRVTTVEDFHRKRSLYQLTGAGQAAEQAIAFYEEAIGRRGQLQAVALARRCPGSASASSRAPTASTRSSSRHGGGTAGNAAGPNGR